jgi:hypothetical protein
LSMSGMARHPHCDLRAGKTSTVRLVLAICVKHLTCLVTGSLRLLVGRMILK